MKQFGWFRSFWWLQQYYSLRPKWFVNFYVFVLSCVCYVLCASVYMCFVVTCWERADLLALVCGVFCEFVTLPLVSWVRCGTWLYRFLIFAPLLTFTFYWSVYFLYYGKILRGLSQFESFRQDKNVLRFPILKLKCPPTQTQIQFVNTFMCKIIV